MAAARDRAGLFARGERSRADPVRAVRERRDHGSHARPGASRCRCAGARLLAAHAPDLGADRRCLRAAALGDFRGGDGRPDHDPIVARARKLSGDFQSRLFPGQARDGPPRRARRRAGAARYLRPPRDRVMDAAGILMLLVVGGVMIVTGLPTWLVLIGTAAAFAAIGVMIHALPLALLASAPSRLIGLLENDLLQALPLYVLMGALLNRLPMAQTLFRVLTRVLGRSGKGAPVAALALGAVFAPMNGSVGASVVMLGRTVAPRLASSGLTQARGGAVIAMASTLGVVIPPSLVLILLGDAMLRAHTEAVNITGRAARIINTQDVFRGALVPAAAILVLALVITWWRSGASTRDAEAVDLRLRPSEAVTALAVIGGIIALLAAVTLGYVYAVEAAAAGGVALFAYGVATRSIG